MEAGQLNNLKIGYIIQARMQSTRLPGKVLMPIPLNSDKIILSRIINSLKKIDSESSKIIIATSHNKENEKIEKFCNSINIECFRGDEKNVLSRYIHIIEQNNFDIIVRLTGDNPIIDTELMLKSIINHFNENNDYTYTSGLPLGMNFEIIKPSIIPTLRNKHLSEEEKEHVTLFFRKNSGDYKIEYLQLVEKDKFENLRITVDYPSDYLTISAILSVGERENLEGLNLVRYCLKNYPWIYEVNIKNIQK